MVSVRQVYYTMFAIAVNDFAYAKSIHTNKNPVYPQRADGTRGLAILTCCAGFPERIIHRDRCHDIADIGFGIIRQGKSGFRAFDRNLQLIIPFQDIVEEVHCSFGTGLEQVTAKFFLFVTANFSRKAPQNGQGFLGMILLGRGMLTPPHTQCHTHRMRREQHRRENRLP